MPTYRVELTPRATKQVDDLDTVARRRVLVEVQRLEADPFHAGVKALQGSSRFRARAGDWRILFEVEGGRCLVLVVHVGHRREVYR